MSPSWLDHTWSGGFGWIRARAAREGAAAPNPPSGSRIQARSLGDLSSGQCQSPEHQHPLHIK